MLPRQSPGSFGCAGPGGRARAAAHVPGDEPKLDVVIGIDRFLLRSAMPHSDPSRPSHPAPLASYSPGFFKTGRT
jgi:hypothetical protein